MSTDGAPAPGTLVAGRVTASRGGPAPEVVLTLIDRHGRQAGRTAPDAEGTFRLAAPGLGEYVLLASAPGYHPQAYGLRLPGAGPEEIVLQRLVAQVVGQVRAFPSGLPVAGALVVATDDGGVVRDTARSADDGGYALGGLGAGPYTVTATADDMWPAAVAVMVPGSTRTVTCHIDMLEPAPAPRGSDAAGRWAAAKQQLPPEEPQPAAGSASPATSASTSPVWPARTALPPSTTT